MHGFTSHTYMRVNAKGERFWVKYHFKTDQARGSSPGMKPTGSPREYKAADPDVSLGEVPK